MNINELIEQIGGRGRLEKIASWSDVYGRDANVMLPASEAEAMASALLAVMDAQSKPALVLRPFGYDGETFRKSDIDHHAAVVYYTAPPAASAPDRNQLRELVDMVWNEATESETVPSTADADRIIDKVFHGIAQEPASSRYQSAAPAASASVGLAAAVNRLLDSDGSRGRFSAIRRGDALAEVERLLAAAPAQGCDGG